MNFLFVYPPVFGAYTELFAGLSPDVVNADWGKYRSFQLRRCLEVGLGLTGSSSSCAMGTRLSSPRGH